MTTSGALGLNQVNGWEGPTYALAISNHGGSAIVLSGWRLHQANWEERFSGSELHHPAFPSDCAIEGDLTAVDFLDTGTFEFEIVDEPNGRDAGELLTQRLLGKSLSLALWRSASTIGLEATSANRDLDIGLELREAGFHAVDFKLCTLPSRRGVVGAPVIYGTRWLRIYAFERGVITIISSPPSGSWNVKEVRWPHHGIHSRSIDWYSPRTSSNFVDEFIMNLVTDITRHQKYFAETWAAELELWEQRVFRSLTGMTPEILGDELSNIEQELGWLAEFLSECRIANRNLERRAEVSQLIQSQQKLVLHVTETAASLSKLYNEDRQKLRSAMALLSTLSSSAQARTAEVQRKDSERIQQVITLISVIFLAPLIVIGVYGANLNELSDGAKGNFESLLVWILVALGISWAGLSLLNSRPIVPGSWKNSGLLLFTTLAALILADSLNPRRSEGWTVTAIGYPVIIALTIFAFRRGRKNRSL